MLRGVSATSSVSVDDLSVQTERFWLPNELFG